jgi:hypothetical protein
MISPTARQAVPGISASSAASTLASANRSWPMKTLAPESDKM